MEYIAHILEDLSRSQSVKEHLDGTANFAFAFADAFGCGSIGRLCAQLHDAGKYSEAFQERIRGSPIRVDHATAGAQEASRMLQPFGRLLAYCIAGHHGGLPDGGNGLTFAEDATLDGRLHRTVEPYSAFWTENILDPPVDFRLPVKPLGKYGFSVAFWIRMLYSALVDADFLDTERFMSQGSVRRGVDGSLHLMEEKLRLKLAGFSSARPINRKRGEILEQCLSAAAWEPGLFRLTVPTGGGKTLSSLAFALAHAREHGLSRIIYVIPYTSIIEQNGAVFKEIFGEEAVLEHHSQFDFGDDQHGVLNRKKLASENWDAPLVVTTNVQFFESLFACKSSRCRKLHNIVNSVIIFDEAQMFPLGFLHPCVRAIAELVQNYGCTAVLCSATQPVLDPFFPPDMPIREICRDPAELYRFFRRTRIVFRGEMCNSDLLSELDAQEQALCIVSTRKHARDLFSALPSKEDALHLSNAMCPKHRKAVIEEIHRRLKNGAPCRVISTQLIEAGVDVDFPVVYRSMAGLDSLVQSAGRCNREGKQPLSDVFVFEPEPSYRDRVPESLRRPLEIVRGLVQRFDDLSSPEAIASYFLELYELEGEGLDKNSIVRELEDGFSGFHFPFRRVASRFRLIDENTSGVIIAYDGLAQKLISQLRAEGPTRDLMRRLQPYTVDVYQPQYQRLRDAAAIEQCDNVGILLDLSLYDANTGLSFSADSGIGIFV